MPHRTYVFVDTAKVQEYILAPGKLRMNRGASRILNELTAINLPDKLPLFSGRKIYANGANILASFPDQLSADRFIQTVHADYQEQTGIVRANCVSHAADSQQFSTTFRTLLEKMARAKASSSTAVFNTPNPFAEHCSACGLHVSTTYLDDKPVCTACHRRHQSGETKGAVQDFEEIGRNSSPENYLALLYVDLDRMGEFFETYATPSEERCEHLATGVDRALREAISAAGKPIADIHAELLCGGDDAAVMLPASYAFDYLHRFRQSFHQLWAIHLPDDVPRPPFSAALVIAHSHFPIKAYFDLAKQLLASAKRRKGVDSLDWELVSSSNSSLDPIDARVVAARSGLFRTAKPYSWDDFDQFRRKISKLKADEVPTSKIHSLYPMAYLPKEEAEYEYFRLLLSLDGTRHRDTLMDLIGKETLFQTLYTGDRGTRATDAVELWEFL